MRPTRGGRRHHHSTTSAADGRASAKPCIRKTSCGPARLPLPRPRERKRLRRPVVPLAQLRDRPGRRVEPADRGPRVRPTVRRRARQHARHHWNQGEPDFPFHGKPASSETAAPHPARPYHHSRVPAERICLAPAESGASKGRPKNPPQAHNRSARSAEVKLLGSLSLALPPDLVVRHEDSQTAVPVNADPGHNASIRAGTCLCHGVPANSSRQSDEVREFGAIPVISVFPPASV